MQLFRGKEAEIWAKCCNIFGEDFTQEDIEYLHANSDFRDALLSWFESSLSDGCWTGQSVKVMQELQTTYPYIPRNNESVEMTNF